MNNKNQERNQKNKNQNKENEGTFLTEPPNKKKN